MSDPECSQRPTIQRRRERRYKDCQDIFLNNDSDTILIADKDIVKKVSRDNIRPRSACERSVAESLFPAVGDRNVFCFETDTLHAQVTNGGTQVTMREEEAREHRRSAEGDDGKSSQNAATVKNSSQRLSGGGIGLQVNVAAAASMATSTPVPGVCSADQWCVQTPPTSAAPHSPGALSWHGEASTNSDKSIDTVVMALPPAVRLSRKESYKAQRQNYRREKKRAASALLSTLEDPAVLILADWLKVRGSLKSWTKLWCVLKPGLLLLYKSPKAKSNHWVGTVLLSACHVIERPSKKDGFCFKLYNPLEQTIWAPRGPHNETIGAVVQPLPTAHLIFRAPSQAAGKCWLDGLELALRCSSTLLRTSGSSGGGKTVDTTANHETQWSHEDLEKHFNEQELEGAELTESDSEGGVGTGGPEDTTAGGSSTLAPEEVPSGQDCSDGVLAILQNVYSDEAKDDVGQSGEVVEELGDENKSLLWFLVKQVRPGMDLSKVVLPTFILEPRSFLDKLSDSFYHSDILAKACRQQDAYERMVTVVRWYLSGLYRKPKGLKKPYNPVLGEVFRCCWIHPDSGTRTYYVSEQVSHHPPVSAFYVSNRKEGFAIEATILAKSKYYGNSTSAILEGLARVVLLPLTETYFCTSPYAHCKGLLIGTLSMELGGRVTIHCPSTEYSADIEFKLKTLMGRSDCINMVSGRIRHHKDTVATIEGYWDGRIDIKDKKTQEESVLQDVSELKLKRLRRQLIVPERQGPFESQRLWKKVSEAIANEDQVAATEEKTIIEEAQRERAKETGSKEWIPKYFTRASYQDGMSISQIQGFDVSHPSFQYKFHNFTPWDDQVDVLEYEEDFAIKTLRKQATNGNHPPRTLPETEHSASESDSTNSRHHARGSSQSQQTVAAALLRMEATLREQQETLAGVSAAVRRLQAPPLAANHAAMPPLSLTHMSLLALALAILVHYFLLWIYPR